MKTSVIRHGVGVDQTDFFLGRQQHSNRETVLAFVAERLEAVKWRNWKLAFYEETRNWFGTPEKLTMPKLFNLTTDPKEEYPEEMLRNTWVMVNCLKTIREFYDSSKNILPFRKVQQILIRRPDSERFHEALGFCVIVRVAAPVV